MTLVVKFLQQILYQKVLVIQKQLEIIIQVDLVNLFKYFIKIMK